VLEKTLPFSRSPKGEGGAPSLSFFGREEDNHLPAPKTSFREDREKKCGPFNQLNMGEKPERSDRFSRPGEDKEEKKKKGKISILT